MKITFTEDDLNKDFSELGYEKVQPDVTSPKITFSEQDVNPTKPRGMLTEAVGSFGAGINQALGAPVNLFAAGLNALGANIQNPVGGSNWLNQMTGGWKPEGMIGTYAQAAGEELPLMLAGPMAKAAKTGAGILKATKPMLPSAAGAAFGAGTAREFFPDSPMTELGLTALGGAAPAARTLAGGLLGPTAERLSRVQPDIPFGDTISGVSKSLAAGLTPADDFMKRAEFNYVKAVRPSISGKTTTKDYKDYLNKAGQALKSIVYHHRDVNKPMPDDLMTFSEAVQDTRRAVFDKYSKMSGTAETQGLVVDITPVLTDLENIRKSKALADWDKRALAHVDDLIDTIKTRRTYTPKEAEEAIAVINGQLEDYYKSRGSQYSKNAAGITDTVVRFMRAALDEAVEKAAGDGYQNLKNEYGALRTIEKDVINRAIVDARKANVSLLDFSDMFSASKGVYAAAKLDPAGAAAAGTIFGVKQGMKHLNDPNRMVKKMFKGLDKNLAPKEQWTGIPGAEERFTMKPYEGEVTNERGLVTTGRSRQQTVDADYRPVTPLGTTPRAGLLESPSNKAAVQLPWNPQNRPGGIANRTVTAGPTVQEQAKFDWDSVLRDLVEKTGMSSIEARDHLLRMIKEGK